MELEGNQASDWRGQLYLAAGGLAVGGVPALSAGGSLWGACRSYPGGAKTVVARMSTGGDYEPLLTLPSGGDNSYAGLVWHDGLVWMSYYSALEGKTSIYLAKIKLRGGSVPGAICALASMLAVSRP